MYISRPLVAPQVLFFLEAEGPGLHLICSLYLGVIHTDTQGIHDERKIMEMFHALYTERGSCLLSHLKESICRRSLRLVILWSMSRTSSIVSASGILMPSEEMFRT